jgi:hypothetical protein
MPRRRGRLGQGGVATMEVAIGPKIVLERDDEGGHWQPGNTRTGRVHGSNEVH